MKHNKNSILLLKVIISIAVSWFILTLIVESASLEKTRLVGKKTATKNALIVYDPDPIYNFDEQICNSFAEGLSTEGWLVKIITVTAAYKIQEDFDLYVFCTNTYNFAPDWSISHYIKHHKYLEDKTIIAITLGAGSTDRAQKIFEEKIKKKKANLLNSKAFWLMRPNNEDRLDESNIDIAIDMANAFGRQTAKDMEFLPK